ncbi:hypothetical protein F5X96DRAFT_177357 [Biscogniauxia mediterranea]|nr:hypothetical protein F5X96DRAFT_177357 [Biscogniauxia mediterranea]
MLYILMIFGGLDIAYTESQPHIYVLFFGLQIGLFTDYTDVFFFFALRLLHTTYVLRYPVFPFFFCRLPISGSWAERECPVTEGSWMLIG